MSTCISQHGEYGSHDLDTDYTCQRCGEVAVEALIEDLHTLRRELHTAQREVITERERYESMRNERIQLIIFGHHPGAPKPFALYRKNADRVAMAVGAEFPDSAVAVRLNHNGGWFTYSDGGAQRVADADDLRLVWLSDELEPLAQMEQERDAARADVAAADQRGYERAIEVLRAVLVEHFLFSLNCDHEAKTDTPWCGCASVDLGTHPTVGDAVQAWADHVMSVASSLVKGEEK